jgi:predicted nuclease of predicted toxin-antitoxin system
MRILLDECMPIRLLASAAFAGHHVVHVAQSDLAGLPNGELHERAQGGFDLLITSDRHFRDRCDLAPTPTLGIVFVRVVPNVADAIQPALEALAADVGWDELIGKRTAVWRDRWDIT